MSKYVDVESLDFVDLTGRSEEFSDGVMWILEQLDKCPEQPTAHVKVKSYYNYGKLIHRTLVCSNCGVDNCNFGMEFCPWCGAKFERNPK